MASGVNKVILVGNLGKDPETREAGKGTVCGFPLATNESWTDKDGQKQERTEWHSIAAWGKLGEICAKYLKKGRQVYVEGRLQTRSWEDDNGNKRYRTEIVATDVQFLGGKDGDSSSGSGGGNRSGGSNKGGGRNDDRNDDYSGGWGGGPDDDIPF